MPHEVWGRAVGRALLTRSQKRKEEYKLSRQAELVKNEMTPPNSEYSSDEEIEIDILMEAIIRKLDEMITKFETIETFIKENRNEQS
jgi:hypothetical protein